MDNYTVWYQTSEGINSGKKALNLRVDSIEAALTQASQALSDAGWTLVSMREYNALEDQEGSAYLYSVVLSTNSTDVPA